MKKLLLLVTAFALSLGSACAQNAGMGQLQKSPVKLGNKSLKAPRRDVSLDETTIWGYYTGAIGGLQAVGTGQTGTFSVAMKIPGTGITEGASICGINLPIYSATNMSKVTVFVTKSLTASPDVEKAVDKSALVDQSYVPVALDEEYTIPAEGVYVGYSFEITRVQTQGDAYPILTDGVSTAQEQLWLKMGSGAFEDYSGEGFGASGLQVYLKGMNLNGNDAHFVAIQESSVLVNETTMLTAMLESSGSNGVQSFDYTINCDGNEQEHHVDLSEAIAGGLYQRSIVQIPFDTPADAKVFNAQFTITKVNGEVNECAENELQHNLGILLRKEQRVSVEEEYTGLSCGWCPRGLFAMGQMAEQFPDTYIGITVHNYGGNDPMRITNYWKGFSGSAPSCFIDRRSGEIDPYYGAGYDGIAADFQYYNAIMPEAVIDLQASYTDEKKTSVDITANVEMLTMAEGVSVVYVLTADDLSNSSWKQSNYYSSSYASQTGLTKNQIEEELQFLWDLGKTYDTVFNDVAIASSYNTAGKNLAEALTITAAGEPVEQTYKLTFPTRTALKAAINPDKVYAVAMVIGSDGAIMNAAKVKVETPEGVTGISSAAVNTTATVSYNLNGVQLAAPQQGVNIVRMANGQVKKVVIK